MKASLSALSVSLGLLVSSSILIAHHGTAAYETKLTTLKGVVTDFQFINPHSEIYFDVKNDKGEVEKWIAEGNSATVMARFGWTTNSLKPGDEITVTGNRSKNGSPTMHLRKLVLANGKELPVERDFENY
jgi:hypothetical protein